MVSLLRSEPVMLTPSVSDGRMRPSPPTMLASRANHDTGFDPPCLEFIPDCLITWWLMIALVAKQPQKEL